MAEPLSIVFMGSDPIALPLLDWLAGEGSAAARIAGIFTGADRPSGRGQAVRPNPVRAWASSRPIEVRQPEKLDAGALADLRAMRPDLSVVVAYGHILREEFISAPRLGTLNLHASVLPRYRGASPIQSAVASGEAETGMTLMRIVRELDAGPAASVERVPIGSLDTAADVEARLAAASVRLMAAALPLLAGPGLRFEEQDHAKASYCRRLVKADGVLDFSGAAAALAARINGLYPWPSVTVDIGGAAVRVGLADASEARAPAAPGTVLGADGEGLLVSAGAGTLRLRRLQRPGGRMMDAREFLLGFPVEAGTIIPSGPMPALVAPVPFKR